MARALIVKVLKKRALVAYVNEHKRELDDCDMWLLDATGSSVESVKAWMAAGQVVADVFGSGVVIGHQQERTADGWYEFPLEKVAR